MALMPCFILPELKMQLMSPNAVRFLSVAYGERSVSASHADAGLKGMNGEGHGTLVFT